MAKVAIDIRLIGSKRTGDETVFFELTKKLVASHPEHSYVLLTDKNDKEVINIKNKLGISPSQKNIEIISFGPTNKFVWNGITIPIFFLKRSDIQVFHTQYILPFWIPKHIQVVAHIHDISFARYPEFIPKKDLFFLRLFIPRTLKRAFLVVPSIFTKTEIKEVYKIEEDKITVVPNAPSEQFQKAIQYQQGENNDVQQKYGLPKKYLLYVGTLQPRKNIPYLLQMFAEAKKNQSELRDLKLVLVGNKLAYHFDTKIETTISALNLKENVVTPGFIDAADLPSVYRSAKAFLFPSVYEGFGIPILEALTLGIPTLVSDIPVHREIGGERVQYFPLNNVAEAAEILYTVSIANSTKKGLEKPFISIGGTYSWSKSATILAHLYTKILH